MSQSSLIQVKVEQSLKHEAEVLFDDLGIDMSSAIRIFLKQSLIHNGLPFSVTKEPFYSSSNIKAINESIRQIENGEAVIKTAEELEAMTK